MSVEEVNRIIRGQHGVIARKQAKAVGLTSRQIDHRVSSGVWIRIGPGVYRHSAVAPTWRSELLAACLLTGGVASHRSAAALNGVSGFGQTVREITVAEGLWKPTRGVTLHQTTQWYPDQHRLRDGIPCTDLKRTIIDVAGVVSPNRVEDAIDAVLGTNRLDLPALYAVVARHARQGRNGCGVLRDVLDQRMPDSGIPLSRWSRMVGNLLVDRGLPTPQYEHRILDPSGTLIAQVDLAYPDARVAIELDSIQWHFNRKSFSHDRNRWNAISLEGWTPLAFTWPMYVDTPSLLVGAVQSALDLNLPST